LAQALAGPLVTGNVSGVCVDAQNHVFTVNCEPGNLVLYEQKTATPAPPITEFDPDGNLVNSLGNRELLPAEEVHGCYVDYRNNIWVGGNLDGVVQKWTHDGSKMLLQIGTKDVLTPQTARLPAGRNGLCRRSHSTCYFVHDAPIRDYYGGPSCSLSFNWGSRNMRLFRSLSFVKF
jgi:hypothetical protein